MTEKLVRDNGGYDFDTDELEEEEFVPRDLTWKDNDGAGDAVSYRPKRQLGRQGYTAVIEKGEPWALQQQIDSARAPVILNDQNGGKKRRRAAGNATANTNSTQVPKPHKPQVTAEERQKVYSPLGRFATDRREWLESDEILEVRKINRAVRAVNGKWFGENGVHVDMKWTLMPSTTAERYTDNSGLTALNWFKLQAALMLKFVIYHLRPLMSTLEFGAFSSSSRALTSSLWLLRLLIQHLMPFMLVLKPRSFRCQQQADRMLV
jgi:hypothetical protein